MLQFIISNTMYWKGMAICFAIGIVSQILLGVTYANMLAVTQEIGRTRKRWLLTLKKKYQNYGKLGVQVQDIDSFVGRQLEKQKILIFKLSTWETIIQQMMNLCMLIGVYGALYSIFVGRDMQIVYTTLFAGLFLAGGLNFFRTLFETSKKKENISYNIKDYLENILKNHLYADETENIYGRRKRISSAEDDRMSEVATARMKKEDSRIKARVTREEEKLVEEVLKDYFDE
ncbi:MAG: hypothetical protein ACI4F9_04925 [Lachnospiraceae bacterium]